MKKVILGALFMAFGLVSAQEGAGTDAFKGKGDLKAQVGVNFQDLGTGIVASVDYGLAPSFSVGVQAGYLLGTKEVMGQKAKFDDRFDVKVRASAHLGDVIGMPQNLDFYPGLNLGLKNFGAHAGVRYFFDKGFGVYGETKFPIARYNTDAKGFEYLNNQFNVSLGVSFDF